MKEKNDGLIRTDTTTFSKNDKGNNAHSIIVGKFVSKNEKNDIIEDYLANYQDDISEAIEKLIPSVDNGENPKLFSFSKTKLSKRENNKNTIDLSLSWGEQLNNRTHNEALDLAVIEPIFEQTFVKNVLEEGIFKEFYAPADPYETLNINGCDYIFTDNKGNRHCLDLKSTTSIIGKSFKEYANCAYSCVLFSLDKKGNKENGWVQRENLTTDIAFTKVFTKLSKKEMYDRRNNLKGSFGETTTTIVNKNNLNNALKNTFSEYLDNEMFIDNLFQAFNDNKQGKVNKMLEEDDNVDITNMGNINYFVSVDIGGKQVETFFEIYEHKGVPTFNLQLTDELIDALRESGQIMSFKKKYRTY